MLDKFWLWRKKRQLDYYQRNFHLLQEAVFNASKRMDELAREIRQEEERLAGVRKLVVN